jgi:non-specific serine/threonine protein kinase
LERALSHAPDRRDRARAEALIRAGRFGWDLGRYKQAEAWLTEAIDRFAMLDDSVGQADSLINLGLVAEKQADDERAAARFEEGLALYRGVGDSIGVAEALGNLADLAFRRGNWNQSAAYADESIAIARGLGDRLGIAANLANLGQLALQRGDVAEARTHYRDVVTEARDLCYPTGVADGIAGFAAVALAAGDIARAARLLGAAHTLCERLGVQMVPHHGLFNLTATAVRARLGNEQFSAAWQSGIELPPDQAMNEALALADAPTAEPAKTIVTPDARYGLTARELEVLQLLVAGYSDRQIGDALFISWRTAQGHVAHICNKLGVGTRAAVVAFALRAGLVTVDQISET